ncbi:MAG: DEAD/DEAH box helicase, partial [Selenomonadaceae bacterium]|nr:DEAD/DEAH box helicase [Selenomonadaceae bacterium]
MTIDELLNSYREIFAMSEAEKGDRFERLMKNFLLTYPIWRGKISDVWRWKDFPFRVDLGGKDLGIDLVVKTHDDEFWAAQCKFYAESTTITKSAVDSFISNSSRTFNGDKKFSRRLWIATSDNFTDNAREMFKNQSPAVEFIDLATLRRAQVNWSLLDNGFAHEEAVVVRKLRDYQQDAINAAQIHYQNHTRGKLIMACGTGKTFTSLKIAEKLFPDGKILFLVPSISLLSQTLEEWATFAEKPLNAICICSDATAVGNFDEDIVDVNLPLPAMTDAKVISDKWSVFSDEGLKVIFSTYQSIDVVHELNINFDLIICDEAHRTASLSSKETVFTKVHSEEYIHGKKRMYMTATPKLFKTGVKDNVIDENKLADWSMDNVEIFGEEFFNISFAEAAARGYLSEYKVFVFTVDESFLTKQLKDSINSQSDSLTVDDALKIIGCINALSKKMDSKSRKFISDDPNRFIHTVVAFYKSISDAERFAHDFSKVQEKYFAEITAEERKSFVNISADFVFGSRKVGRKIESMTSAERSNKLYALKTTPTDGNACRILNNVRCLAEGVDVPALDAIIFMASKKSQVEIVQAVGRVMRKAPHKKFGYIIIPVIVPMNKSPEEALSNSEDFKDVWKIINALRAHDENMNIEIERIRNSLTGGKNDSDNVPGGRKVIIGNGDNPQLVLEDLLRWDDLRNKIYARMVEHVGNHLYWVQWTHKIADIVKRHMQRIRELISVEGEPRRDFYNFLYDLQHDLNPSVTEDEAVNMLAQHLITRPVFEALFENYSFSEQNPVSRAMQKILERLEGDGMTKDREVFARLYEQVRNMCSNMGDAATRQSIIIRLYENFFEKVLEKTAKKLGIVYTPVEVVDFILRSVDDVLYKNFGRRLSDENVHVLDPFTGTGTFIVRLIQSGLIKPRDLLRKYHSELHANELVLLAYYIAAINIENAFYSEVANERSSEVASTSLLPYFPYSLICFTDTFELYERGEQPLKLEGVMKENSERVNEQKSSRIEVIVGNPPYRVGQNSANDNNQNQKYKNLEARIAATYAKGTNATLKSKLYDSYIKAFRWASDRISDGGVIGFVTNAGWLDGAAMDGLRKCFADEFSAIYVFNLRGNA